MLYSRCHQVLMEFGENTIPCNAAGQIKMHHICVLVCHQQSVFAALLYHSHGNRLASSHPPPHFTDEETEIQKGQSYICGHNDERAELRTEVKLLTCTQFSFPYSMPPMVVCPYPQFLFPGFQFLRFPSPVVNHGPKRWMKISRNKQLICFKLHAVLTGVMKSHAL